LLSAWISAAISSLPVPVSPRTSTVMSLGATRVTASSSRRIAGDSPTMLRPMAFSAESRRFCTRSARASSARSITSAISSMSNGLVTYS
jgi:hypothetical protein